LLLEVFTQRNFVADFIRLKLHLSQNKLGDFKGWVTLRRNFVLKDYV